MTDATTPDDPAARAERERSRGDRRRRPTPMFSRFLIVGRRRGGRREGESERVYVDRPGVWAIVGFVIVSALSVADAFLTLNVLSHGAREANPMMQAALSLGSGAFVVLKTLVTLLGAGFLCLHKNWPLGRVCLWLAVFGYGAVTAWHIYGQWWVIPAR